MVEAPLNLRDEGRYRVLQALHERGACRRAELMRLTGLSRATISSLVAELTARGLIEERPERTLDHDLHVMGRPANVVSIAPDAGYAVGVDIGHEHVRVAVCNLQGARVAESSARRHVDLAPQETLDLAAARVESALAQHRIKPAAVLGLGLAIAAPVRVDTGFVEAAGIMPGWVGINAAGELRTRVGIPVQVIHGADAGALAEHTYGAARGFNDLLYVRLAAGIGAGIIAGGHPVSGFRGISGELGHTQVVDDGPICRCGNRGCLETVASLVAVADLLSRSWHRTISGSKVLQLLKADDLGARRAVQDAAAHIGKVLAAAVNLLNPALVLIGGDFAQAGDIVLAPIRAAIDRAALPAAAEQLTIACGQLGEHAEVLGAAALILTDYPRRLAAANDI